MINLLGKTYDFIKEYKFADKKWKGVKSEKIKSISAGLQQVLVLLDRSWQVRTCPNHDFWSNLARFGSRNNILMK